LPIHPIPGVERFERLEQTIDILRVAGMNHVEIEGCERVPWRTADTPPITMNFT